MLCDFFIELAFELYATGDYTLNELSDEPYDRGLHTRPTQRRPAQQVSINKLSLMLRDRYYLGYVTCQGEEYQGRHEPLIDEDLFDHVQGIIEAVRQNAKERRRVHRRYRKGSIFCGRCQQAGHTGRLVIQHVVNSRGTTYTYFFCRNKQTGTCDARHVDVMHIVLSPLRSVEPNASRKCRLEVVLGLLAGAAGGLNRAQPAVVVAEPGVGGHRRGRLGGEADLTEGPDRVAGAGHHRSPPSVVPRPGDVSRRPASHAWTSEA